MYSGGGSVSCCSDDKQGDVALFVGVDPRTVQSFGVNCRLTIAFH